MSVIQMIQAAQKTTRKIRRPKHPYVIEHRPYQIQPFFIAPVLPGETMKNLNVMGRCITDPLALGMGNIMPWWHEMFFFYVRLTDLDDRQAFVNMALDGTAPGLSSAADTRTFYNGRGIDFVRKCLDRVTVAYFRDDGETTAPLLDTMPLASAVAHKENWADSLSVDGPVPTNNDLQNPEGDRDPMAAHAEAYERMRAMRMIDLTYEEYLETYGVRLPTRQEENVPELIRYTRNWTYPTNVVDPATGVPTGAASWSINETADKDRLFKYPGFIFGVSLLRAKVLMGNQTGSMSSFMNDAYAWLPPEFRDRPESALREFVGPTSPNGPLNAQTSNYWVDLRDLLLYGDQFRNVTPAGFAPAIPTAAGEKRFMTSAMIDALFAQTAANKIRQDGMVSLNILGHPTTSFDNT